MNNNVAVLGSLWRTFADTDLIGNQTDDLLHAPPCMPMALV